MISLSTALNNARLTGVKDFLDTGSGNAQIAIYGSSRPAAGAAAGASPLVTIALAKPCGTVAGGVLTLATDGLQGTNAAEGVVVWARVTNGNGDFAFDCDAGPSSSAAEIKLSTGNTLYAGGTTTLQTSTLG